MDAASQRGIDDIREIRERVVLAAGRGPLEGLHHRRGASAHRRRLERAAEADRGAAAAPPVHLLHDRALQGAADRALALPDVRLPAAAAARSDAKLRRIADARGDRRPRRRARADRTRRPRRLFREPSRRSISSPTATGGAITRSGRAATARRGRGGGALPALRPRRRRRHRGCARLHRGALRAGPGHGAAGHRICSSTCAT